VTSFLVVSTSITLKNPVLPERFLQSSAVAHNSRVNCDEMAIETDYDNLRTGTAIGFRAFREHWLISHG